MIVIPCDSASPGNPLIALACPMDQSEPPAESSPPDDRDAEDLDELLVGPPDDMAPAVIESLNNAELAQLIARIMRQDEAALSLLYEQLSARVYAVAIHITRQVACAEEVLQDTFWQIWRQAPRFDPQRGTATAWVLTMARSRSLDARRAAVRNPVQAVGHSTDEEGESSGAMADDPLDLVDAVRRDSTLHAALEALDPVRRQLISLAFFRGLTHDEIASHTGLPLGTVKSHVRRALAALQAALGSDLGPHAFGNLS